jgi:hypothetical protein
MWGSESTPLRHASFRSAKQPDRSSEATLQLTQHGHEHASMGVVQSVGFEKDMTWPSFAPSGQGPDRKQPSRHVTGPYRTSAGRAACSSAETACPMGGEGDCGRVEVAAPNVSWHEHRGAAATPSDREGARAPGILSGGTSERVRERQASCQGKPQRGCERARHPVRGKLRGPTHKSRQCLPIHSLPSSLRPLFWPCLNRGGLVAPGFPKR